MNKIGHKIILLLTLSVLLSSLGGASLALKGFTQSKEEELLEKNAQVVLAVSNLVHLTKNIDNPELNRVISSYPLFGVGIVDSSTQKIILSNGGLTPDQEIWDKIKGRKSSAAVSSLTLETIFLSIARIDESPYVVIATAPRASVWHLVKEVYKSYLLFLIPLTLILGFIGSMVAKAMVRPIEELTSATDRLAQGKWDLDLPSNSDDEIGILSKAFFRMGISLKERERTIREINEELTLSEKLASIGQFSSGIAHEIKNPLASISTHLQLLQRSTSGPTDKLPEKVLEKTDLLLKEVARANRIITDILGFSRQDKINPVKTDLKNYLEKMFLEFKPLAESKKSILNLNWKTSDLHVEIDQDKIRQVFANLLSNSLDALNGKNGIITLNVSSEKTIKIEFTDNGPGIPEDIRKKIFDPFFTSKPIGKGTGLGLSVCHGIIKQHGGNLTTLQAEQGAAFLIVLPLGA